MRYRSTYDARGSVVVAFVLADRASGVALVAVAAPALHDAEPEWLGVLTRALACCECGTESNPWCEEVLGTLLWPHGHFPE